MIKIIVLAILGFSSFAHAEFMDKDRGGANGVNGQLFDFYENQGTEAVNIESLPVFKNLVAPALFKFDATHPGFYAYVTDSMKSKKWYLEEKELSAEGCLNGSMVEVQRTILACQSQYEVRINNAWMQAMLKTDAKQVAGMIIHEFLVAKMLANPGKIKEESVRHINRHIFAQTLTTEILVERGFPAFKAAKDITIDDTNILTTDFPLENRPLVGKVWACSNSPFADGPPDYFSNIMDNLEELHALGSDASLPTNARKIYFAIENNSRRIIKANTSTYPEVYDNKTKVNCAAISNNTTLNYLKRR